MRRAAKVDRTQAAVANTLRAAGCSVTFLHQLGDGTPDLLVGCRRVTYLLEVKNADDPPSRQRLTPAEEVWHRTWRGLPVAVVGNAAEALRAVGLSVEPC